MLDSISKFEPSTFEIISIIGLKEILSLIFENNVFEFQNEFYKQKRGLAMGAICGPSIANIVVYRLEEKWMKIHRPLVYRRFIDDILIISIFIIDIDNFKKIFLNLKLNIIQDKIVNFLDLSISFDKILKRICIKLFIKPTNTFSYVPPESNHSKSIIKNIPVSIFLRVRRICTDYSDYLLFSRLFFIQLIDRGYNPFHLCELIRNIGKLKREELLPYKIKKTKKFAQDNKLWFCVKYNKPYYELNKALKYCWLDFNDDNFYKFKFCPSYAVNNNLRSILVHGAKFDLKNFYFQCTNCNELNCKCCKFMSKNCKNLNISNNFSLPILNNNNCCSENCIYILYCKFCNSYYIGETSKSFKIRLNQHINSIKKFKSGEGQSGVGQIGKKQE